MVEITISKFKDVDIPKLASFMFEVTRDTVFHREDRTRESLEQSFKRMVNNENVLVLIAIAEGEIVGVLRVFTGFPEMFLGTNWHPRIHHDDTREEIAMEIIQFCKEYVKENGFKRFEINLGPIGKEHTDVLKEYKTWCEKSGLYRSNEELFLQLDLQDYQPPSVQPSLPDGFRIDSIDNITNEEIKSTVFKSFADGSDRGFADLTRSQKKSVFDFWFRRNQPFHRSAMFLVKDNEIVGFNVVRVDDDSARIGPLGVIPKHQRKGIMKSVLHDSIKQLQEDGIKIARLEVDKNNNPAIGLYAKFGFNEQYSQQYYAWRVQ